MQQAEAADERGGTIALDSIRASTTGCTSTSSRNDRGYCSNVMTRMTSKSLAQCCWENGCFWLSHELDAPDDYARMLAQRGAGMRTERGGCMEVASAETH